MPDPKNECTSLAKVGIGQSFTLLTFSRFGKIPSFESKCPRNKTLDWKKKDFLGFILRLNSEPTKYQCYPIQHLIDRAAENADVIQIEKEH